MIHEFPLGRDMTLVEAPLADTLFHGACPVVTEGTEYVYLVNSACSFCIAKALDCYQFFLTKNISAPFIFLSRSEDYEVFDYYFNKRYSSHPSIFALQKELSCGDGVFLIQDGRVVASMEWH